MLEIHLAPPAGRAAGRPTCTWCASSRREEVAIEAGENAGRDLTYTNIVTDWETIARWDGQRAGRHALRGARGGAGGGDRAADAHGAGADGGDGALGRAASTGGIYGDTGRAPSVHRTYATEAPRRRSTACASAHAGHLWSGKCSRPASLSWARAASPASAASVRSRMSYVARDSVPRAHSNSPPGDDASVVAQLDFEACLAVVVATLRPDADEPVSTRGSWSRVHPSKAPPSAGTAVPAAPGLPLREARARSTRCRATWRCRGPMSRRPRRSTLRSVQRPCPEGSRSAPLHPGLNTFCATLPPAGFGRRRSRPRRPASCRRRAFGATGGHDSAATGRPRPAWSPHGPGGTAFAARAGAPGDGPGPLHWRVFLVGPGLAGEPASIMIRDRTTRSQRSVIRQGRWYRSEVRGLSGAGSGRGR